MHRRWDSPIASSALGIDRIEAWAELVEDVPNRLLIGGEWRGAADGAELGVDDPGTGERLCQVADARDVDAAAAMDAGSRSMWPLGDGRGT